MDKILSEQHTPPSNAAHGAKTLAVIGGGLAGIASALAAADAGWRVTLFEAKRHLGGRAASIETPDGLIDNGRHLILDACTETRRLIRRLGAEALFDRVEKIPFLDLSGRRPYLWRFGASRFFPGRTRFFPSFAAMPLSWGQKRRLLETLERLQHFDGPDLAFGEFLGFDATSDEVRGRFWDPIILSALCDTPDAVSTAAVKSVIFSGVFGVNGPALTIPNRPLREIFHTLALKLLTKEKITTRLGSPIRRLIRDQRSSKIAGCETVPGETLRFDRLILAAAPFAAERILRNSNMDDFADSLALTRFLPGAITAVHLWLAPCLSDQHAALSDQHAEKIAPSPVSPKITGILSAQQKRLSRIGLSDEPMVLDGEPGQWFFPGPGLCPGSDFYAQVLISGSHKVLTPDERRGIYEDGRGGEYDIKQDDKQGGEYGGAYGGLIGRVMDQLRRHFPQARFSLQKGRVTTVPDAVTIPTPALFGSRPTGATPFENFSLAGDWLETGWPSTMEGAIRSGAQFGP